MLISRYTLMSVGLLDPTFRTPGWGADSDYSHRITQGGGQLYVSHRAMVWHHRAAGGLSAEQVYGGKREWLRKGLKQIREDMETKYGPDWRKIMPTPDDTYDAII
jgi:GT2 family glycosyltransferase